MMVKGFLMKLLILSFRAYWFLTTDWKYNSEIVEEGKTGWLVEPKNEKALEEKLIEILYNKEKLNQMRKNCVEEAKKYHVDNVLPKLLKEMNIEV